LHVSPVWKKRGGTAKRVLGIIVVEKKIKIKKCFLLAERIIKQAKTYGKDLIFLVG
jgi:hypothetical protein